MKITLIRHGETEGNLRKAYIGSTDEPLSLEGISKLQTVSNLQKKVYVSNKIRTQETAKILFPQAELEIISLLEEMNFGLFEGKNFKELEENVLYQTWISGNCQGFCPKGERMSDFIYRCKNAFYQVATKNSEDKIFVIHGGTIMAICSQFVRNSSYFQWQVPCGTVLNFHWNGTFLEELT